MNTKPFDQLRDYLLTYGVPEEVMRQAEVENHFFTRENILSAVNAIANDILTYPFPSITPKYRSCVVIMAGNIPLVGFVDLLCCLVAGVDTYIKPSSKDRVLMSWVVEKLSAFGCKNLFLWNEAVVVESVIATGSNNANRYFELQFGDLPMVKRGSRTSVAVIDGTETDDEIMALWHDIFDYFGLGCRSVSHLFIPLGYDTSHLFSLLSSYRKIENSHFLNAYRQVRALKIMTGSPFFDGSFFVASHSVSLTPALGEITYSFFDPTVLDRTRDLLQCVVGHGFIPFGEAQHPALTDWADGVDLFRFFGC
ncbi:MAG: aldehyde dehydrogenase [Rikenellaceae bacterium]